MLVEPATSNAPAHSAGGVVLGDQDAVGIEHQAQHDLSRAGVVICDLVERLERQIRPHESAFDAHADLLDKVFESALFLRYLRLHVLKHAIVLSLVGFLRHLLHVPDVFD